MTDRQVDTELLCIKMTTGTEQEELIYIWNNNNNNITSAPGWKR